MDSSALASLSGASKRRCSAESSSDSAVPPTTTSASLSPVPAKQPRKSVGEFLFSIVTNLIQMVYEYVIYSYTFENSISRI